MSCSARWRPLRLVHCWAMGPGPLPPFHPTWNLLHGQCLSLVQRPALHGPGDLVLDRPGPRRAGGGLHRTHALRAVMSMHPTVRAGRAPESWIIPPPGLQCWSGHRARSRWTSSSIPPSPRGAAPPRQPPRRSLLRRGRACMAITSPCCTAACSRDWNRHYRPGRKSNIDNNIEIVTQLLSKSRYGACRGMRHGVFCNTR